MNKHKPVRITTGDIYKAYVKLLKEYFPDINIMNVLKDYPRPAFFPKLEVSRVERTTSRHIDSQNVMRLYYFPEFEDNSMVELANIQDKLTEVFWLDQDGMIEINGVNIEFYDIEFHRVDDVLHCYVPMHIGHGIYKDDEDIKNMGDLQMDWGEYKEEL